MKRVFSIFLSMMLLVSGCLFSAQAAETDTHRVTKVWYSADFNNESTGDAVIRNDEGYVGTEYVDDGLGGKALHIKSRVANYDGLRIDVSDMLGATDIQNSSEGYSAGFRIKAEMGKQFWLRVEMYGLTDANGGKIGNGYLGNVESYTLVTDEWQTVSIDSLYFVKEYSENDWANSAVSGNIGFVTKPYIEGKEPYQIYEGTTEAFYIDDINVSAPTDVTENTVRSDAVWYSSDFDNGELGDVSIRSDEGGYVGTEYTDDGNGGKALHFARRSLNYDGLRIDVSDMLNNTDIKSNSEGYSASFRIKAEAGKKFWLRVEMYAVKDADTNALRNGYLGSVERYFLITDSWTVINASDIVFMGGDEGYDRYWANNAVSANIGFVTLECTENDGKGGGVRDGFYIDDIKVTAPCDMPESVANFKAAADALPDVITSESKTDIANALTFYSVLPEYFNESYLNKTAAAAKAKLDNAVKAYKSLVYGDVNLDGRTDILDLVRLKKIIAGLNNSMMLADIDNNGSVNATDLIALRRYLIEGTSAGSVEKPDVPAALSVGDVNFKPGTFYKSDYPVMEFRKSGENVPYAAWWWYLHRIVAPDDNGVSVDMALDLLIANNISEIYLDIGAMVPWEVEKAQGGLTEEDEAKERVSELAVRGFVKKCSNYGIRVAALGGSSGDEVLVWLDPQYNMVHMKNLVNKVEAYNANCEEDEKLYGAHFDVEPQSYKYYSDRRKQLNQWTAELVIAAADECRRIGVEMAWDVFFWTDAQKDTVTDRDGNAVNILDVYTKECDSVCVMAYVNNAAQQYSYSTDLELDYAKRNGCTLIVASEMTKTEVESEKHTTYYFSSKEETIAQSRELRRLIDNGEYQNMGGAVHHLGSFYEYMTKDLS